MNNGSGIGFGGVLVLIFIILKLIGVITWSWLWVLSPIWIVVLLAASFAVFDDFNMKGK